MSTVSNKKHVSGIQEIRFDRQLPGLASLGSAKKRWIAKVKEISMLSETTLEALHQLVRISKGTILEIGSYLGGGTIVLAQALKERQKRKWFWQKEPEKRHFLTVECGGANPSHPQLPSNDILADLEANLKKFEVRDQVEILAGYTFDFPTIKKIRKILENEPVGLMILDSNGLIGTDLFHLTPYCQVPCYLVIDDYLENLELKIKSQSVQPIIQKLIEGGFLETMGLLPWGTWFGKIVKPIQFGPLMTPLGAGTWKLNPPFGRLGHTGWVSTLDFDLLMAHGDIPFQGSLKMFENGKPLGPPDSPLHILKNEGKGAYHQWGGEHSTLLMFTTSDNSDPNQNGCEYSVALR